jgi:broad specificity phosphatase PhoE
LLVLARHGRTAWNLEGRFQGWADPPLDEVGRRQSAHLAAALTGDLEGPAGVYSSDLRRARETAAVVASALACPLGVDPALREVNVGAWEGLTGEQVRHRFPIQYREWSENPDGRRNLARGGGETLADAGRRVADRLARILLEADGAHTVVIGHGMALQMALDELCDRRVVDWVGPAPHLGNGEYLLVPVLAHPDRPRSGSGPSPE